MTKRRSVIARARPVGGRASVGSVAAGTAAIVTVRRGRVGVSAGQASAGALPPSALPPGPLPPGAIASSAVRIALMWAGVVPQQPPMMAAPAATNRGVIAAR